VLHFEVRFGIERHSSFRLALRYGNGDNPLESTKDSLPLCKSWLKDCAESHGLCNKFQGQWKPTRLIYLKGDNLRISLSSELDGYTKYATLSHCWGHHKFTMLMRNNFENFRVHIPLEGLSKTFKDAIHTTRFLGLQYLWIDSLCILQDDPDDWTRESSSMSGVYGGATINIAASGAVNGSLGCFFNRHASWRCQIQAMVDGKDSLLDCIQSRYHDSLKDVPLATRGWVIQERYLSPRTLHFTPKEIFWECHEKVASETFPERVPPWGFCGTEKRLSLPKRPITNAVWFNLIEEYSRCELTFARDKLVAISGLARIFQAEIKDDYLAGLWKKDLKSQLLWYAVEPDQRPLPPTAPSWSWASLRGAVTFDFCNRPTLSREHPSHIDIKIEQVNVMPFSPSNPLGEVSEGCLRVNCEYLLAGILHKISRSSRSVFIMGRKKCYVSPFFDTRSTCNMFVMENVKMFLLPIRVSKLQDKEEIDHSLWADQLPAESTSVTASAPTYQSVINSTEEVESDFGALMIQETGRQRGQYQRIGMLIGSLKELEKAREEPPRIPSDDEGSSRPDRNWNGGQDILPSLVDETKCVEIRVDEAGKKRYIIDIV
jgi:hypothetical protein